MIEFVMGARANRRATTDEKVATLARQLRGCGSVCIGYSGGVDSAYLAAFAVQTLGAENVLAVTGLSPAYPAVQRRMALACARHAGIPHLEIRTDELLDPNYAANPSNRCYYCKSELWPKLVAVARERGFAHVLDGSNADDADDYRPGFAAAREHGVISPLMDAGLTKQEIRALSQAMELPSWDRPSAPCLSSRLPYGVAVTPLRLEQVELAEEALVELGFVEFRVRHHDDAARIELAPADIARGIEQRRAIVGRFRAIGFDDVLLDVDGYRRGALNEALVQLARTAAPAPLPPHRAAGFHRDIAVLDDAAAARASAPALRDAGFRYIALDLAAS